jgi:PqqD family protein of HPr-rel-A system
MRIWTCLGARRDLVAVWDESAVAFNALSGETHVLNAVAAAALLALFDGPTTTRALARRLARDLPPGPVDDWDRTVEAALRGMEALGLVEATDACA